jgi:hypothetical protein
MMQKSPPPQTYDAKVTTTPKPLMQKSPLHPKPLDAKITMCPSMLRGRTTKKQADQNIWMQKSPPPQTFDAKVTTTPKNMMQKSSVYCVLT